MNEPAFPGFDYINQDGKKNPEGMTLRDYFAAKAMQGILSSDNLLTVNFGKIAKDSYAMADAMMEVRNAAQ